MKIKAYAKINLTLEVLRPRNDGYHEVRTVLQTIDLSDILEFELSQTLEFECSIPGLSGEDNLVLKAARSLQEAAGCTEGARISLTKRIPVGMGVGGGSTDAAATLVALNGLWNLRMSDHELQHLAGALGSDVPFFLRGGTALGEGRGEALVDLPPLEKQPLVLVCPQTDTGPAAEYTGRSSKTARAYALLTAQNYTDGSYTTRVVDALKGGRFSWELCFNTFEEVAARAFPSFGTSLSYFLDAGARAPLLTGTGPALYAPVSGKKEGEEIVKSLKMSGLKGYCVSTVQAGAGTCTHGS